MKKIYIIHGYFASVHDHWFPWLHDKMSIVHGMNIEILPMPTPETPSVDAWLALIQEEIGVPDKETFVIAHSLGCIALLRHLESIKESFSLGGMILVSPFDKPLEVFPNLDAFVDVSLDYARLSRNILQKHVILSDNDMYVPPFVSKALCTKLDAALLEIPHGGHFLGIEGFEMFPELYEILKTMLAKK